MPSEGFENANPAIKRLQTFDLDHRVTLINNNNISEG
jgi:hypothetical protein